MTRRIPTFCVYRYYDADDRLLYIGVTWNPDDRLAQHRHKAWHGQVARQERVWFEDRMDAFLEERRATHAEAPLYPTDVDSWKAVALAVGMVAGDLKRRGLPAPEARAIAHRTVADSGYATGHADPRGEAITDEEWQAMCMDAMREALNRSALLLYGPEALRRAS